MAEQRDNALLLRSIPYSDSSLILHFFTENHGRISLMARGARRAKSSFRASLMPLHQLQVRWKEPRTGTMGTLLEVQRLQSLLPERYTLSGQDLLSKASALFPDGVEHGYYAFKHALEVLAARSEKPGLCAAIWSMISASGWSGDFHSCWHCSEDIENNIHMYWRQSHLLCKACANNQGTLLNSGYRKTIEAFLQNPNIKLTDNHVALWNMMIQDIFKTHQLKK